MKILSNLTFWSVLYGFGVAVWYMLLSLATSCTGLPDATETLHSCRTCSAGVCFYAPSWYPCEDSGTGVDWHPTTHTRGWYDDLDGGTE